MARRDRYAKLVWLAGLPGDPADGRLAVAPKLMPHIHQSLTALTAEHRLWVEFEQDGDVYHMRCYPRLQRSAFGRSGVCTSYVGRNISAMVAAAVADYHEYTSDPTMATLSPREVPRWVV